MPRVILKCRYIKHEKEHLSHLVRYIATREGAEPARDTHKHLPATIRQKQLIHEIRQTIPGIAETYEYQDYMQNPCMGNASELIAQAIEQNMDLIAKKENYVDYIANRPGVEKTGAHGLFTDAGIPVMLSSVQKEVAGHEGYVWTFILSIGREDAGRLGYDDVKSWEALLRSKRSQMAEAMKISPEDLRWYAAFHNEGHHPHVHIIAYSQNPEKGFLTEKGIEQMRSMYAKEIFRQDLYALYQEQTSQRDELIRISKEHVQAYEPLMDAGTHNIKLEQLMAELSEKLKTTKGKKVYGYLPPRVKQLVNQIVDELAAEPMIAGCYQRWYESRVEILHTYTDQIPVCPPLSSQKEFKQIKNMIIQEAMALEPAEGWCPEAEQDEMLETIMDHAEVVPQESEYMSTRDLVENETEEINEEMRIESIRTENMRTESIRTTAGYACWSKEYKTARKFLRGTKQVKPDFDVAFQRMTAEAEKGNAFAMCDLGYMLLRGSGCNEDPEIANAWYERALNTFLSVETEEPSNFIEYRIGKLYAAGLGTEQNHVESAKWFSLSADAGNPYAQYSLGMQYRHGQGVSRDDTQAADLFRSSMASGNPYAAWEYGKMARDGIGMKCDTEKAEQAFKQAFRGFLSLEEEAQDDKLYYRIGKMFQDGIGTEQNEEQAICRYQKAIELKNVHAMRALADIYLNREQPEWIQQGIELLEQAANRGDSIAMYRLGLHFLQSGDTEHAIEWLEKSAEEGNFYAEYKLGKLFYEGKELKKNPGAAVYWLTVSAGKGNQYAQYLLGKIYLFDRAIGQDRESGMFWLNESAAQGNIYAIYLLEHQDAWIRMELHSGILRLFHHLSGIFEEQQLAVPNRSYEWIDRKRRKKLMEKKMAQGIY